MAFVVTSLPDYVNENKNELITKAVFGAKTASLINVQTGVKYKDAINILSTDPVLQERTCSFDASGNVTFTQDYIEVGAYKVNMSLCEEDLRKKWMNDQIKTAAGAENLPFEQKITSEIVDNIDRQVEQKLWVADTTDGDLFNGILTILKDASSGAIVVDASAATSVYDKVLEVYKAIPNDVIDKAEIFMGVDDFRTYCIDITRMDLHHYVADYNPGSMELIIPGTNVRLHGVSGLTGTHAIVAANPEYLIMGTDMQSDMETFDLWYSKDNQEFRLAVKFNLGAAVAFKDLAAYYAPAE